jgi:hypothetical protein
VAEKISKVFGLNISGKDLKNTDLFFTLRTLSEVGRGLYLPELSPGGPLDALMNPEQVLLGWTGLAIRLGQWLSTFWYLHTTKS